MSTTRKCRFPGRPLEAQGQYARKRLAWRKGECGAALVEYAFIFIFFMTLVFGIGGFGHALYAYHFVNNAAKEATRWAAVNGSTCTDDSSCNGTAPMNNGPATTGDIQTFVNSIIPSGVDPTKVTVTPTWPISANSPDFCKSGNANFIAVNHPGCTVQVQVQYTFNLIFPLLPSSPLTMSSTSEIVIAH